MTDTRDSRTDRVVFTLALFGTLALATVATGTMAGFVDSILGGLQWVVENGGTARKVVRGSSAIVDGVVTAAGAGLKFAKSVDFLLR
jgi:hypothetical protein